MKKCNIVALSSQLQPTNNCQPCFSLRIIVSVSRHFHAS